MNDVSMTPEGRLRDIQRYISRMPSLSTTVTKVMEICNKPDTSPNDLNRVISLDPVLTGQVLKLVNSAYYALPNQVTSLTRAIIMLGLNTVKNLALSAAVLQNIGQKESFQALSMEIFWTHSITVGVTAKRLAAAKKIPIAEREEYFVAGLLHDLGKIPLNNRFPDEYLKALRLTQDGKGSLYQTESAVFGINHCIVGKMIAEKWKLSEPMMSALSHHHHPQQSNQDFQMMINAVALADTYGNMIEKGTDEERLATDPTIASFLKTTGVPLETLLDLQETVVEEVEKAKVFLQVTGKG